MGGRGVRSRRGAGQPGAAVLDAANPRDVRAASARRAGLHLHRLSRAYARRTPARRAAWRDAAVSALARLFLGGRLLRGLGFLRLRRGLARLRRLRAELLREAIDAAFGVDQLLAAGEERVAVRADVEVELLAGGAGRPRMAAGAVDGNFVVFRVEIRLHVSVPFAGSKALDSTRPTYRHAWETPIISRRFRFGNRAFLWLAYGHRFTQRR